MGETSTENETSESGLTRQQEKAVLALLSHRTIAKAAEASEVGESTLYRWLTEPAFRAAVGAARREALRQATTLLQRAAGRVVRVLQSIALDTSAPASSRVSAARTILEMAFQSQTSADVAERLAALERGERMR